jgi:molybdopterin-guanine dinucleotide biosynthesis protein A
VNAGPAAASSVLGVILAGGANRRYGGRPKALARVDGERIADRAIRAMRTAADRVVIVANDPETFGVLELPLRPDIREGFGVLGGILTAVAWAAEEGYRGALVAACDMPFLAPGLLRRLAEDAGPDEAVLPESDSRRGMEPLCAYYGVGCRAAIEAALDRGDRAVISFLDDVDLRLIPRDEVVDFGDPDRLFLNVNTPEDRQRAEAAARSAGGPTG